MAGGSAAVAARLPVPDLEQNVLFQDLERIREDLTPCEIILTDIEDTTPDERVVDFYRLCGKLWKMDIRDLVPTTMSREAAKSDKPAPFDPVGLAKPAICA